MPVTYKLYYFDLPGKGEAIRLALTYANIPFEDVRLDSDSFAKLKEDGTLAYGQAPALEVTTENGRNMICQSATILRYIGRIAQPDLVYPTDPLAASAVDSVLDAEIDFFSGLLCSKYRSRYGFESIGGPGDAVFDKVRGDLNTDVFPRHLGNLNRLFANSTTGWVANTAGPSIADFCLAPRLGWLSEHGEGISSDILKPFPKVVEFVARFYSIPDVMNYYKSHGFRFT
jgi:glutathione S-transferase